MKKLLPLLLILTSCNFSVIGTFKNWDTASRSHKAGAVILTIVSGGTVPLGGLIFKRDTYFSAENSLKDLEAIGSNIEAKGIEELTYKLNTEFGLSSYRSQEAARIIHYYSKKAKAGSLTKRDSDYFLKSLTGIELKDLNQLSEQEVLERVSEKNETSPEHIRSLLTDLFN